MSENDGMDMVEFLDARIAEDEAYARQAQGDKYGWIDRWRITTGNGTATESVIMAHAFRLSPVRMLAECAAKREIVALHGSYHDEGWLSGAAHEYLWCGSCGSVDDSPVPFPCETLMTLAAVYKDHADYRQEWASDV